MVAILPPRNAAHEDPLVIDGPSVLPDYEPTMPAMLAHVSARFGDLPAVMLGEYRISYRELNEKSAELARGLLAMGFGKSARIGILLPNGPDYVIALAAVTRIGALAAPLSTLYQGPELAGVLQRAAVECLITCATFRSHDYLKRLEGALDLRGQTYGAIATPRAPYLRSVLVIGECQSKWARPLWSEIEATLAAKPKFSARLLAAAEALVRPSDPVIIIHTSGSKALPKGIVHSHGALLRHTFQISSRFTPLGPGEGVVALRPFFWIAGLAAQLFLILQAGACHITPPDTSDETILRLIEQSGATMFAGDERWHQQMRHSPVLLAAGLEVFELSVEFSAVARRLSDGSAVFLGASLATRIPRPEHVDLQQLSWNWGMTESLGAHTSLPFGELAPTDRPRVGGRTVPGVRARIRDTVTGAILPSGSTGELELRGYCMMIGMEGLELADVLSNDGYFPTGDLVTLDEDGYITLIGRLDDTFKVKGANVAPLEVEHALSGFAEIERSCVMAVPDGSDNMVVAAVQVREGQAFDEARVIEDLKTRLSSYKVPKRLITFAEDEIPIVGSGKIRKQALRAMVLERLTTR